MGILQDSWRIYRFQKIHIRRVVKSSDSFSRTSCCIGKPSSGHAATLNPRPHSLADITLTRCLACTNWKCMSCRYGRLPTKLYYMQQILIYTYIVFCIDVAAVYVVLSTCLPPHKLLCFTSWGRRPKSVAGACHRSCWDAHDELAANLVLFFLVSDAEMWAKHEHEEDGMSVYSDILYIL